MSFINDREVTGPKAIVFVTIEKIIASLAGTDVYSLYA